MKSSPELVTPIPMSSAVVAETLGAIAKDASHTQTVQQTTTRGLEQKRLLKARECILLSPRFGETSGR